MNLRKAGTDRSSRFATHLNHRVVWPIAGHEMHGVHRGRRTRTWVAAFSVFSLLLLGASPALAADVTPAETSVETVVPEAGSSEVVSETPQETAPPAPVVEEPPMPPTETPAPVPPASEEQPAPPESEPDAGAAQTSTEAAGSGASVASTAETMTVEETPEPPYLRWVVIGSEGEVVAQEGMAVSVQGPSDASDAASDELWANAPVTTVQDNTGREGYIGADLDKRVGHFTVKQLADDADPTSVHDVVANEQFRLRPLAAEGFVVGDEASWMLLSSSVSADEPTAELVLAQPIESPGPAAKETPQPAALAIAPLAAALTQGTYKPDKDDSAPTGWGPSPSGSTIPGQALLNNLSSAVNPEGSGWRYTASWDREGTTGTFGWTIEYTNAPERWGAANTLDGSGNPTDQSVPQPNRSAGGTTIKIENNATTAQICTYSGQSTYPGDWANTTRCRQVTAAVSYSNGGLHVSVSFLLPSALFGSPGCPPTFGSTSYARSWTGTAMNLQAWHAPQAFTPPSNCGTTTLKITKMGDRNGTRLIAGDSLTEAAPVVGARYDAYASTSGTPGAPTGPSLGFCITGANGVCTIAVSNGNTSGVWVQETSSPSGWSNMPSLGIGAYDQSKTVTPYQFKVAVGSGSTNVTKNVTSDRTQPNTDVSNAWVDVRDNPSFPEYCGVSIAMVFDTSTSINESEMDLFKQAGQLFVGSGGLGGTPSKATMFRFSTTASKMNGGTAYDLSVQGSAAGNSGYAGASAMIGALPSQGDGFTNWDDALRLVKTTGDYDMVLFLTDGDPTTYAGGSETDTTVQFRMVEQAAMSANALKTESGPSGANTKIVAVGVGLTSGSEQNLKAISGPTQSNDYFLASNFDSLKTKLQEIAAKNCGGTLTVVKKTIDANGTVVAPASGWEFEASTSGAFIKNPPGANVSAIKRTTPNSNFALDLSTAVSHDVTVKETPQAGWAAESVSCTGGTSSGTAGNFTVTVARNQVVSCTVVNRELPKDASITATKVWVIQNGSGQEVLRVNQTTPTVPSSLPTGIAAQFQATGPGSAAASELAWGATRGGYKVNDSVTVSESMTIPASLPGCSVVSQKITKLNGTAADIDLKGKTYAHTLVARTPATSPVNLNDFEVTNTIKCSTQLTLLKQVQGGDADPNKWTITASGPTGPHNATGSNTESPSNTFEVQPGGSYSLSEALVPGGPMTYMLDRIERCTARAAGGSCTTWVTVLDVSAISVGIGTHETYRFVNKPAPAVAVPLTGGLSGELFGGGGMALAAVAILLGALYWRRVRRQAEVQ